MKKVILLRGVTPTGQNRIPKMAYLVQILAEAGFSNVVTYIQSGNIILETDKSDQDIQELVHQTILEKIGADLSVIVKTPNQLTMAIQDNPFDDSYDRSRIYLVFSNDKLDATVLEDLAQTDFDQEIFRATSQCLYLYLPREAKPKRLNTNYLEKRFNIRASMRKLSVIKRLAELLIEEKEKHENSRL